MNQITSFHGEYRWLSNFWPVPIYWEGATYPSVENAYQAAKVPPVERVRFVSCSAGQAKRLSRQLPNQRDWNRVKVAVMHALLARKFVTGSLLAKDLMATDPLTLVEGNDWGDVFWGVCNGQGHNMLGSLLMRRRAFLIEHRRIVS